jgi:hypothetical protein
MNSSAPLIFIFTSRLDSAVFLRSGDLRSGERKKNRFPGRKTAQLAFGNPFTLPGWLKGLKE